ncbi:helix-turn-helix transcriptional regulator [Desulfosporosinus sp. BG]|uniref:substrate-binding domain-containing protein n=1 Tax=Desulfosporosinus sp. BG TaxID=1633135 RepID=UPI00083A804C|nr:helix-turn-helix transcriptional regulator [Desulfosporosinus sp. BG]ODA39276.1 putative molybdate-responsive regulator YvgK in bacilli [Desulfosporosinus sp. BG]
MSEDVSYTPEEVAKILNISKYTVYELIKRDELAAYRIGRKVRVDGADIEAFKRNTKNVTPSAALVLPPVSPSSYSPLDGGLIICGQDMTLDILTRHLERKFPHVRFLRQNIGSIDGLMALYRGMANVVTAHLWDSDTNEYNTPYVRRMLPGHRALLINMVYRTEGFYVAKGNPKKIFTWTDLARPDLQFVNRERGSGARVLLDEHLRIQGIAHQTINGYSNEEMSHIAVASKIARGEADVGLGIEKAAQQVNNVDFVPLQIERYDIVVRKEDIDKPYFQALLSILKSAAFRNEVLGIGSYDVTSMGEIMAEV